MGSRIFVGPESLGYFPSRCEQCIFGFRLISQDAKARESISSVDGVSAAEAIGGNNRGERPIRNWKHENSIEAFRVFMMIC